MRRFNLTAFIIIMGISLLLGFLIFAALGTAIAPTINNISKPMLCSGEYTMETTSTTVRPGETYSSRNIYCDGKDITVASVLTTGTIASLFIFIVLAILARNWIFAAKTAPSPLAQAGKASAKGKTPLERMAELKEMRDQNLISQVEYERKKDEIMKEL